MNDQVTDAPVVEVEQTEVVVTEQETEATPEKTVATPDPDTEAGKDEKDTQAVEKTYSQKEYDEATAKIRKKAEAVAERRALKAYAEKLEGMQKPVVQEQKAAVKEGKPTIAQFGEDVEGYVEAVAEWKLRERDIEANNRYAEVQAMQVQKKAQNVYAEAEKIQGFDREAFDDLPITDPVAFAIMDSDIAPKIMAHLSEHPEEAERIVKLSPARQAAEIGKLEVKLSETKTVKASSAPDPIKPIGSRGSVASTNPEEMDYDKYRAMRAKQGARWAK